jgi:hypothetical protein
MLFVIIGSNIEATNDAVVNVSIIDHSEGIWLVESQNEIISHSYVVFG